MPISRLIIASFLTVVSLSQADQIYYQDLDGDGFGVGNVTIVAPSQPNGYSAVRGEDRGATSSMNSASEREPSSCLTEPSTTG